MGSNTDMHWHTQARLWPRGVWSNVHVNIQMRSEDDKTRGKEIHTGPIKHSTHFYIIPSINGLCVRVL